MSVPISVYGTPAGQGSKTHLGGGVMVESSKQVKPWRQDVKAAALETMGRTQPHFTGPVAVTVTFYLPRPKSHYRTGKNAHLLKDSAPRRFVATRPDADKLLRSTLDGLGEAGIWRDDAQAVWIVAKKVYADSRAPGAAIAVEEAGS